MLRTQLCDMFDMDHPVMLAGMGGVSYHRVVAAVTEGGGIGTLGAAPMTPDQMDEEMAEVRKLTDGPFGVDLLTAMPGEMGPLVERVIRGGARLFVAGLGVPRDVVELCHDNGVLVANMCGKVRHALASIEAGCDLVIAQGTEAGGHTGLVATMPLVPQIVDAVDGRVPVVAAGGIVDGRGHAAALSLGAAGVWIGTRFIATPEARTVDGYKEKLLATAEDGTVVSRAYSGKPMRVVRSEYVGRYERGEAELQPFPDQMLQSIVDGALHLGGDIATPVDPDLECYPAGQGVGAIDELIGAAELVGMIVDEAEAALTSASSFVVTPA